MWRSLKISLLFLLGTVQWLKGEPLNLTVNATSAILINPANQAVLFKKEPTLSLYPASLTKVATALYTLNRGGVSLDSVLTADAESLTTVTEVAKKRANYSQPAYWLETDGSHIGLKKGEQMPLSDLLSGMMVSSGNDAANVVAQYVGGSIPQFMAGLNSYLKELGCTSTHFLNPHGLHHPEHVATASDLALLAAEALKNPFFCALVSSPRYMRPKTNMQEAATLVQTNRLLRKGSHYYSKATGMKTGYHARAQHNLIASAKQGDRTLVAVLLHNADRGEMFKDAVRLFEAAFKQPKVERTLLSAGAQPFSLEIPGAKRPVETYLKDPVVSAYYPAEEPEFKALLYWEESLTLPIKQGQRVGEVRLIAGENTLLATSPLYASHEVTYSLFQRSLRPLALIAGLLLLIFSLSWIWRGLRNNAF